MMLFLGLKNEYNYGQNNNIISLVNWQKIIQQLSWWLINNVLYQINLINLFLLFKYGDLLFFICIRFKACLKVIETSY